MSLSFKAEENREKKAKKKREDDLPWEKNRAL